MDTSLLTLNFNVSIYVRRNVFLDVFPAVNIRPVFVDGVKYLSTIKSHCTLFSNIGLVGRGPCKVYNFNTGDFLLVNATRL